MLAVCWQYQGSRTAVVVYRRNPGRCARVRLGARRVPRVFSELDTGRECRTRELFREIRTFPSSFATTF